MRAQVEDLSGRSLDKRRNRPFGARFFRAFGNLVDCCHPLSYSFKREVKDTRVFPFKFLHVYARLPRGGKDCAFRRVARNGPWRFALLGRMEGCVIAKRGRGKKSSYAGLFNFIICQEFPLKEKSAFRVITAAC